jgi:LysM repeat protein
MSNNMLDILKNLDAAVAGDKPSTGAANVNDMKTILESIQSVEECGMEGSMPPPMSAPTMPERDKVRMNVNMSAEGTDGIADLLRLVGGAAKPETPNLPMKMPVKAPMPMSMDGHDDMARLMTIASDEHGDDMDMDEEWDNAPAEVYEPLDAALASGDDLHKSKKSYKATAGGDNPMAVEEDDELEEIKSALRAEWDQKLGEEELVRGIQSNGATVNFNIDKKKPKTTWKKGADTMTLYATPEEIAKARDLKGWKQQKAAAPAAKPAVASGAGDEAAAQAAGAAKAGVDGPADAAAAAASQQNAKAGIDGSAAPAAEPAASTEYTVVAGDNLTKIAKANNTTIDAIAKLNGIKDVNKIQVNQKLKIPGAAAPAAAPAEPAAEPGIVDKAQDAVGGAVDKAQDAVGGAVDAAQAATGTDTGAVGAAVDAVQAGTGAAVDAVQAGTGAAVDAAQDAAGAVGDAVSSAWDSVKSWASDTFGSDDEAAVADTPEATKKSLEAQMAEIQSKLKELEAAEQKDGQA